MAGSAFAVAGDFIANSALQAQQAQYNKEAQDSAFAQSLEAQSMAPANYAGGLRSAGLPLSLAMHGSFQPATSPNPLPVSSHPVNIASSMAALEQAAAQTKLVEAQADNLNADTESKEIENIHKRDEDFSIDANLRGQLEVWANDDSNPQRQAAANLMLDSNELYTKGTAEGIKLWNTVVDSNDRLATDLVVREFERLLKLEMKDNGALASLAKVPNLDVAKLAREIVLLEKDASKVSSETDVNIARLDEIAAHIRELIESADLKYSEDLVKQFKNKDKSAVFINLTSKAVNAAAAGAGFGIGSRAAGKAFKPSAVKPSTPTPAGYHTKRKYTQNKKGFTDETWRTPFPSP